MEYVDTVKIKELKELSRQGELLQQKISNNSLASNKILSGVLDRIYNKMIINVAGFNDGKHLGESQIHEIKNAIQPSQYSVLSAALERLEQSVEPENDPVSLNAKNIDVTRSDLLRIYSDKAHVLENKLNNNNSLNKNDISSLNFFLKKIKHNMINFNFGKPLTQDNVLEIKNVVHKGHYQFLDSASIDYNSEIYKYKNIKHVFENLSEEKDPSGKNVIDLSMILGNSENKVKKFNHDSLNIDNASVIISSLQNEYIAIQQMERDNRTEAMDINEKLRFHSDKARFFSGHLSHELKGIDSKVFKILDFHHKQIQHLVQNYNHGLPLEENQIKEVQKQLNVEHHQLMDGYAEGKVFFEKEQSNNIRNPLADLVSGFKNVVKDADLIAREAAIEIVDSVSDYREVISNKMDKVSSFFSKEKFVEGAKSIMGFFGNKKEQEKDIYYYSDIPKEERITLHSNNAFELSSKMNSGFINSNEMKKLQYHYDMIKQEIREYNNGFLMSSEDKQIIKNALHEEHYNLIEDAAPRLEIIEPSPEEIQVIEYEIDKRSVDSNDFSDDHLIEYDINKESISLNNLSDIETREDRRLILAKILEEREIKREDEESFGM